MSWAQEESEVYKMLHGNEEVRTSPRQSSSFKLLQEALESNPDGISTSFPSRLSPSTQKPVASSTMQKPILNSVPSPQRVCEKCNRGISDLAVRISEGQYRHPVCYVCSDCGLNLRMRGHFWAGKDLVCEKHARARHGTQSGSQRT
ncbi:PREDICTED: PDZ and LIM domain protein 2 [Nanorana parkeri]|uniref:PDZ and LIM domain protein 2 n=1 Tax=Nanorana parkeri TaxID=125878 RepID=UPI0008542A48|nr:PREDICTED: PDZ and LIM domain protein 2 [Nanorana parkeri]